MIENIILTSLIIFGVHATTNDGMIFHGIYKKVMSFVIIKFIDKPIIWESVDKVLFRCPPCMASLYGTLSFLFICLPIEQYIPFIFAVSGLNYILNKI
jgi:hypothetical protein